MLRAEAKVAIEAIRGGLQVFDVSVPIDFPDQTLILSARYSAAP
jgi:hypothetical protein